MDATAFSLLNHPKLSKPTLSFLGENVFRLAPVASYKTVSSQAPNWSIRTYSNERDNEKSSGRERLIALFKRIQNEISERESKTRNKKSPPASHDDSSVETSVFEYLQQYSSNGTTVKSSKEKNKEEPIQKRRTPKNEKPTPVPPPPSDSRLTRLPSQFVKRSPIPSPTPLRRNDLEPINEEVLSSEVEADRGLLSEIEAMKLSEGEDLSEGEFVMDRDGPKKPFVGRKRRDSDRGSLSASKSTPKKLHRKHVAVKSGVKNHGLTEGDESGALAGPPEPKSAEAPPNPSDVARTFAPASPPLKGTAFVRPICRVKRSRENNEEEPTRKRMPMKEKPTPVPPPTSDFRLTRLPSSFVKKSPIPSPTPLQSNDLELTNKDALSSEVEADRGLLSEIEAMKLSELKELAKGRGLKGYSKLKKGELVELLRSQVNA